MRPYSNFDSEHDPQQKSKEKEDMTLVFSKVKDKNKLQSNDTNPPAELAFKSALGAPFSTDDKKPPAESAFKNAFGALASTDDKKPPAESAFKSALGARPRRMIRSRPPSQP
ncbi:uncharacterized protein Tco025E_09192 [Trypanosoma conorhini]|uniref:Uncharacterized protein n=1 Tax=Trypanosoma conorhini TaxID=83891 RepID=A0A3R7K0U1_9TRYP|nr:uncharacterized protein Tco025E_09192 [Trypanosoma conorhini]RNE98608.1 hypothetical protein Tco025E_09192 [Trypanosoma conorhini]